MINEFLHKLKGHCDSPVYNSMSKNIFREPRFIVFAQFPWLGNPKIDGDSQLPILKKWQSRNARFYLKDNWPCKE